MIVTKLVRLDVKFDRKMYTSRISKLNGNGLRVHGFIVSKYTFRSVNDTRELQRIEIHYQTK